MGFLTSGATFSSIVQDLVGLINLMVGVLAPLALVVFFYGLAKYVYNVGDSHGHKEARETILWSLVALFVLFSVWGILALMNEAFFGGPVGVPSSISPSYNNSGTNNFGTASNNAIY
jgi:hypothetical protein